jgi:hypothetical protein
MALDPQFTGNNGLNGLFSGRPDLMYPPTTSLWELKPESYQSQPGYAAATMQVNGYVQDSKSPGPQFSPGSDSALGLDASRILTITGTAYGSNWDFTFRYDSLGSRTGLVFYSGYETSTPLERLSNAIQSNSQGTTVPPPIWPRRGIR